MNIETHTTDRRALAQQISELLGEPVMYAGAPSFAYRIGSTTLDRNGNLEVPDDVLETLKPFLIELGWLKAEPISEPENSPEGIVVDEMTISFPVEGITVTALKNLTFMLYTRQNLINHMTGENRLWISDLLVNRLREYTPETLEAFSDLLNDCRAMGELEGFDFREGIVTLSFPFDETQPEKWTAYAGLTHRMIRAAQEATRVMPKRIETDNEKYAMRSWLMRLGYAVIDRTTFKTDDTLNIWSGTSDAIAGSLKRGSIAGLNDLDNTTVAKMRRSEQYIHDPDKWVATVNWGSYFELQYHGHLSINDVESVTFSDTLPGNFDVILGKLKRKGVKVYQVKGGSLHEF